MPITRVQEYIHTHATCYLLIVIGINFLPQLDKWTNSWCSPKLAGNKNKSTIPNQNSWSVMIK